MKEYPIYGHAHEKREVPHRGDLKVGRWMTPEESNVSLDYNQTYKKSLKEKNEN